MFGIEGSTDNNFIHSILVLSNDDIRIATSLRGALKFNPESMVIESMGAELVNERYTHDIYQDPMGRIWVSHSSGITVHDTDGNIIDSVRLGKPGGILGGIRCTYMDDQGNVWVGTARNGIMAATNNKRFRRIVELPGHPDPRIPQIVNAVLVDEHNNVWAGYYGSGIDRISRDGSPNLILNHQPGNPGSLGPQGIMAMAFDGRGNILIGAFQDGLQVLDLETESIQSWKNDPKDPKSIPGNDIRGFAKDDQGYLWLVTHGQGITRYHPDTGEFRNIRYDSFNTETSLIDDWPSCALMALDGYLYVGTAVGVSVIDPETLTSRNFTTIPGDPGSLSNPVINCIAEDSKGRIWLGTNDGMIEFDRRKGQVRAFSSEHGLPNEVVLSIIEGNDGNLWVGTSKGLARVNPNNGTIKSFDAEDGLVHSEFSVGAVAKGKDGALYFGQRHGITWFYPEEIRDNTYRPTVHFTDFKVFNRSILPGSELLPVSILYTDAITLDHSQKAISIEFVALNFIQSRKNRYAYRLDGFEADWNYLNERREVVYTNLNPGKYTFRVKAANNDGYWNQEERVLKITVLPPFWMTIWFRLLVGTLILLIPVLFAIWRVKRIRYENLLLENTVNKRTHELKEANEQLALALRQLESNQRQIQQQNRELQGHRSNLEEMVRQRTQELEQAKEKAEQSDRLKSAFLANMSHEIRTPMNAIMGFLEVLEFPDLSEQERRHFSRLIAQSGETLICLIDDILDLSMIEANEFILRPGKTKLHELCHDVLELLKHSISPEKSTALALELRVNGRPNPNREIPNGPIVEVDHVRLKQVITNLFSNAIKFTESGKVILDYSLKPDLHHPDVQWLQIEVQDSGIGIPADQLEQIFERFHKLPDPSGKLHRGTGLGLTISRKLAELMGGSISVESEPGRGSCFTLRIPAKTSRSPHSISLDARPNDSSRSASSGHPDWSRFTVLVAEDEEPNFEFISQALQRTGLNLVWAKDGDAAVRLFETRAFDLILLDLKMPHKSGFEVTRIVRQQNQTIPIIIQSAYAMEQDRIASLDAGSTDFIAKPFTIEQLTTKLRNHLPL
jgi:signal transduction histidine kinase/CheY-like chemotaxis protein/streptogramin lyase